MQTKHEIREWGRAKEIVIARTDAEDFAIWRRRTIAAAACLIVAILIMSWRLGEYAAYLEAAARV